MRAGLWLHLISISCQHNFSRVKLLELFFYNCWSRSRSALDRSVAAKTRELMFVTFFPSTIALFTISSTADVWRTTLDFSAHWRTLSFAQNLFFIIFTLSFHLRPFNLATQSSGNRRNRPVFDIVADLSTRQLRGMKEAVLCGTSDINHWGPKAQTKRFRNTIPSFFIEALRV